MTCLHPFLEDWKLCTHHLTQVDVTVLLPKCVPKKHHQTISLSSHSLGDKYLNSTTRMHISMHISICLVMIHPSKVWSSAILQTPTSGSSPCTTILKRPTGSRGAWCRVDWADERGGGKLSWGRSLELPGFCCKRIQLSLPTFFFTTK